MMNLLSCSEVNGIDSLIAVLLSGPVTHSARHKSANLSEQSRKALRLASHDSAASSFYSASQVIMAG